MMLTIYNALFHRMWNSLHNVYYSIAYPKPSFKTASVIQKEYTLKWWDAQW